MDRVDYQPLLIQDILNYQNSNELNLSPWYQRRSIWSTPQKAYLINTIHEQKPIPAIYIRYSLDLDQGKTIREVVDGQQRTRAIIDYCENKFPATHPSSKKRISFAQLNRSQRQVFLLTAIPVGYLLGATDEDVIDIFGRINSVSKTLNPQEKRNSRYSGEFKQFCLYQASSRVTLWRDYNLFSANDIARMAEVQFISDLTLNMLEGLSDANQRKLNNIYKLYDEDFPNVSDIARRLDRVFDFIVKLDVSYIRDTIFVRQPIFFSLVMVLDSLDALSKRRVEKALNEMDSRYLDRENHSEADRKFYDASVATTQRIRQRQVRSDYIRGFLA